MVQITSQIRDETEKTVEKVKKDTLETQKMDQKQALLLASDIKAQKNLQKKIKVQMKELIDSELIT